MQARLMARLSRLAPGIVILLAACLPTTSATPSAPPASAQASSRPSAQISPDAIRTHLEELEAIADANEGVRTAGTPGYEASAEYVAQQLREMGYLVETPEFEMATFAEIPGARIEIEGGPSFAAGPDFHAMIYSGRGDVTAAVIAIGFGDGEEGGCSRTDWKALPPGAIALTPPGPCFRRQVVLHAVEAGAAALVVAYPQWPAGQVRRPTLLTADGITIPAISASGALGEALHAAADAGAPVHLTVETEISQAVMRNVIAESHGIATRVVMLGGHLDSVHDGPGINDNGSGTAALLAVARLMAEQHPGVRVRFAFWGGEEFGLLGSHAYVGALTTDGRAEIAAYLNFDMLGSPNFVPFVYDQPDAAAGSAGIADFLVAYLESRGIGAERTDLGGGSDHGPFVEAGVATGGIFSGATELKSVAQAEAFGGTADEPMDACYHLACDRLANVDLEQIAIFAEAAAAVTLALATGQLPMT